MELILEMKPTPQCKLHNNVQSDRQWQRRCAQEQTHLIDSYAGPKAYRIQDHIITSKQQHFYTN